MSTGTIVYVDSAVAGRRQELVLALMRPVAAISRATGLPRLAYRVFVESALPRGMRRTNIAESLDPAELDSARSSAFNLAMQELRSGAVPGLRQSATGDLHWGTVALHFADASESVSFAESAARAADASRVLVVGTSRWRARYMVAQLRERGLGAYALSLPDERSDGSTLSGTSPDELRFSEHPSTAPSGDEPLDVLLLAESAAMTGTMLPVVELLSGNRSIRAGLFVSERIPLSNGESDPDGAEYPAPTRAPRTRASVKPSAAIEALSAISRQLSSRSIQESELAVPAVETLLDRHSPRLLVLGNDRIWSGQLMSRMARRRGIPVLCIQDGLAVDGPSWWTRTADYTATNGEYLRDILVRLGAGPETLFVTGQPRMDSMYEQSRHLTRQTAREELGLEGDTRYALLALQGMHDSEYLRQALAALDSVHNLHVIVRPHHWQNAKALKASVRAGEDARPGVTFRSDDDIGTLLRAVDVVVSQYSTILVEAALMRTPAIALSLSGRQDLLDLAGAGIALGARSGEELTVAVQQALTIDESHTTSALHTAEHLLGPFDGRSAERVAKLIESLASSRSPSSEVPTASAM